jgi:predicted nucleic acid-binding protein
LSRIFLDTSIFVEVLIGKEGPRKEKSKKLIEDIVNGVHTGVVSRLVLMELRGIIRRRILEHELEICQDTSAFTNELQRKAIAKADEFTKEIEKTLVESRKVVNLVDPQMSATSLFRISARIIDRDKGFGRVETTCNKCGQDKVKNMNYRAVGAADAVHAVSAHKLGCDMLATTDTNFKQIQGYPELDYLDFMIFYPKDDVHS